MPRRGFTLVELLVVIAIIGLLSTVAMVSLNSSRRQARNAKRIADVRQLATAFNLGLAANGQYPGGDAFICISSVCTGAWSGIPADGTVDAFFQPFVATKPTDPADGLRGQSGYLYNGAWGGAGGFTAGTYLDYALEPPAACGVGAVYSTSGTLVTCLVKLD